MIKITAINGISLSDTSVDLSQGFPSFYRAWLEANNVEDPEDSDLQKAEKEYADLSDFSKRGWCGVERSILRTRRRPPDE